MDALRDHPQVLYGAIAAFVIVILLTPAVGGMARLLGVVDLPGGAAAEPEPDPAARRDRDLLRDLRARARVPRARPRDARRPARRGGRDGRRRDRRLPRARGGRKLAGQIVAAAIPPFFGVWIDHFTFPFLGPVDLPAAVGSR